MSFVIGIVVIIVTSITVIVVVVVVFFIVVIVIVIVEEKAEGGLIFSGEPALWPLLGPMFPIVPVWGGASGARQKDPHYNCVLASAMGLQKHKNTFQLLNVLFLVDW